MGRAAALVVLVTAAACGGAPRSRIATFAGQLPEAVVPLAWLEGRWERPGGVLIFAAAGPALFGVQLGAEPGQLEVMVIDAPVRRAQLELHSGAGAPPQTLVVGGHGRNFASFAGVARRLRVERKRDGLVVTSHRGATRFRRAELVVAPELDAAERGWTSGDALAPMERHVVASAMSPSGDVGFTIGFYRSADGTQRGGYAAVWQKDPAGVWSLRLVTSRRTA